MSNSSAPLRQIPVNNVQFQLPYEYRNAVSRSESALKWIVSDAERVQFALANGHSSGGAQSIASQANILAEAQAKMQTVLEMAKLAFENMDDFWDLVEMNARPVPLD